MCPTRTWTHPDPEEPVRENEIIVAEIEGELYNIVYCFPPPSGGPNMKVPPQSKVGPPPKGPPTFAGKSVSPPPSQIWLWFPSKWPSFAGKKHPNPLQMRPVPSKWPDFRSPASLRGTACDFFAGKSENIPPIIGGGTSPPSFLKIPRFACRENLGPPHYGGDSKPCLQLHNYESPALNGWRQAHFMFSLCLDKKSKLKDNRTITTWFSVF